MIGATSKAEQFMTRSGNESTKGSRKGFGLLGGGECPVAMMTDVQRDEATRHALNMRIAQLDKELAPVRQSLGMMRKKSGLQWNQLLARRDSLASERTGLLLQVQEINNRIRLARPKPIAGAVPQAFVDIAREVLTDAQFRTILKAAFRRVAEEPQAVAEATNPVPRVGGITNPEPSDLPTPDVGEKEKQG